MWVRSVYRVDVRVICATNVRLTDLVRAKLDSVNSPKNARKHFPVGGVFFQLYKFAV
jgi:hypothetical protein